jgi:hypothetical protein
MKNPLRTMLITAMAALTAFGLYAAPVEATVSTKQQLAVFALGFYGYDIPSEALGTIDAKVMEVFAGLKRFEIIGFTQRFATGDVGKFVADLKKIKEENLVLPEKYMLGEAFLTEADMNMLVGSFYIVVPVVNNYELKWEAKEDPKNSRWSCKISTSITFMDVAKGTVMAAPIIETSGTHSKDQNEAVKAAIESIPGSLELEARKVFPLDSKIVSADLVNVKMRLGSNMGIKVGYEFAVIDKQEIDGIVDEREAGLVVIKKVSSEFSDGTILFSDIKLGANTQVREIPRGGADIAAYFRYVLAGELPSFWYTASANSYGVAGLKFTVSEGFYALKPILGLQVPLGAMDFAGTWMILPVQVYLGGEFNLYLRRIQVSPFAGVGCGLYYIQNVATQDDSNSGLTHVGGLAGVGLSYLVTRDIKVYAEASYDYWLSMMPGLVNDGSGLGIGVGATFKF